MSHPTERFIIALVLCVLFFATIVDVVEDIGRGDGTAKIAIDLFIVISIAALLIYIYVLQPLRMRRENLKLVSRTEEQEHDLLRLSQIARAQLEGLSNYIQAQFYEWNLTPAEQDVALMLLKGFSMKEISELRDVSERTTRQQATTIYSKTGLAGRTGLSAFFLEDLLLPSQKAI